MMRSWLGAIVAVVLGVGVLAAATVWRWSFSNSHRDYLAFAQGADAAEGRLGSNQGNPLLDPAQPTFVSNLPTHPDPVSRSHGEELVQDLLELPLVQLEYRVFPGQIGFTCKIINRLDVDLLMVQSFFWGRWNSLVIRSLDDGDRRPSSFSPDRRIGPNTNPRTILIPSGESRLFIVPMEGVLGHEDLFVGRYTQWIWTVSPWRSGEASRTFVESWPVYIGVSNDKGEALNPQIDINNPEVQPILAFMFNQGGDGQLEFLMLNGSQDAIELEVPLTQLSYLVATAPALEYRRELVLPHANSEVVRVEPGQTGQWRLPWQTVLDLIPAEDLERIKAAGGDLDLVWKVGELESAPLPLTLVVPEPSDHHQGDFVEESAPDAETE